MCADSTADEDPAPPGVIPLYPRGPLVGETWDSAAHGPLSEATLKRHFAAGGHLVQASRFPAGARLRSLGEGGLCFVVRGTGRFRFPEPILLQAGQFAAFPAGPYELRALGGEPLEIVRVFQVGPSDAPSRPAGP